LGSITGGIEIATLDGEQIEGFSGNEIPQFDHHDIIGCAAADRDFGRRRIIVRVVTQARTEFGVGDQVKTDFVRPVRAQRRDRQQRTKSGRSRQNGKLLQHLLISFSVRSIFS
jgi:hypothetical protein